MHADKNVQFIVKKYNQTFLTGKLCPSNISARLIALMQWVENGGSVIPGVEKKRIVVEAVSIILQDSNQQETSIMEAMVPALVDTVVRVDNGEIQVDMHQYKK